VIFSHSEKEVFLVFSILQMRKLRTQSRKKLASGFPDNLMPKFSKSYLSGHSKILIRELQLEFMMFIIVIFVCFWQYWSLNSRLCPCLGRHSTT
jgi:hypothetical protein